MNSIKLAIWFFLLSFLSCSVDEFDNTQTEDVKITPEIVYVNNIFARASMSSSNSIRVECLTIQLPFELVDNNDIKHLIADEASFNEILNDSFNLVIVDFVYPINLRNELGDDIVVNNLFEFGSAVSNCIPDVSHMGSAWLINFDNSCFQIEYPISVKTQSNNIVNILNERDFILLSDTIASSFIFPMTLVDLDDKRITINNVNELYTQLSSCNGTPNDTTIVWGSNFSYIACYEIIFPMEIKITDSDSTVVVKSDYELGVILLQARFENYVFPISIKNVNQEVVLVANEAELDLLVSACSEPPITTDFLYLLQGGLGDSMACYQIIYPFTVIDSMIGAVITFQSEVGLLNFLTNPDFYRFSLVYPIRIRLRFSNIEKVMQNFGELKAVLDDC